MLRSLTYYNDYVEHGEEQTDNAESPPKNNNTDQENIIRRRENEFY